MRGEETRSPKGFALPPGARSRLAGLRRRREVAALAAAARRHATSAWIVGGAVRDALLGLPVAEVDAAVAGRIEPLARELERMGLGRSVLLSDAAPRVFRIAGPRPLDLAGLEGPSILADLARRDFTVNALAVDIATGEVLDPHGGLEDLRKGRLRLVSERNLVEDPLRAFRAARFIATHGLRPDRRTLAASRSQAPRLANVAAERLQVELAKILEAPEAAPALAWAARAGLLGPAFGLPRSPPDAPQRAPRLAALDDPVVRRRPPERRRRVRLAMLAVLLRLSAEETRRWLAHRRFGREEAGEVARLVQLSAAAGRELAREEAWDWVRDAGPLWKEALALRVAVDPRSRRLARRLARLAGRPRRKLRVRGRDVLEWTGLSPGPRIGALLAELTSEILRGRIRTRRQARKWLAEQEK